MRRLPGPARIRHRGAARQGGFRSTRSDQKRPGSDGDCAALQTHHRQPLARRSAQGRLAFRLAHRDGLAGGDGVAGRDGLAGHDGLAASHGLAGRDGRTGFESNGEACIRFLRGGGTETATPVFIFDAGRNGTWNYIKKYFKRVSWT